MADCMDETRRMLIAAGIVEESVPPMFVAEAVIVAHRQAAARIESDAERIAALEAERDKYKRLDAEAAIHCEEVIIRRTHFTGNQPYVGWKGLGLALNEALDERDELRRYKADTEELRAILGDSPAAKLVIELDSLRELRRRIDEAPELRVGDPAWADGTLAFMDGQRVKLLRVE